MGDIRKGWYIVAGETYFTSTTRTYTACISVGLLTNKIEIHGDRKNEVEEERDYLIGLLQEGQGRKKENNFENILDK